MTDIIPNHDEAEAAWSLRTKIVVSGALLLHLLAIFAAPCASPPPAAYMWNWLAGRLATPHGLQDGLLTPYLRAGYLNHGYRFFAPNPGPSHLVRYEIDLTDGGQIEGRFPDPEEQWPRLLYHRMFMVSETLFNLEGPVSQPPARIPLREDFLMSSAERIDFYKQRATAEALLRSISRQLLSQFHGKRVRLFMQTHEIPFPGDVSAGRRLDDPSLYNERLLGEFAEEEL